MKEVFGVVKNLFFLSIFKLFEILSFLQLHTLGIFFSLELFGGFLSKNSVPQISNVLVLTVCELKLVLLTVIEAARHFIIDPVERVIHLIYLVHVFFDVLSLHNLSRELLFEVSSALKRINLGLEFLC